MRVKLLTDHHLEFLSLKGGCRGSFESTLSKCQIVGNFMLWLICLLENIPIGSEVNWQVNINIHYLNCLIHPNMENTSVVTP